MMDVYTKNKNTLKDYLKLIFMILLICSLGLFVINQILSYHYKAVFLKTPCKLCLELNPEVSTNCFIKEERLYPNGKGDWSYLNGSSRYGDGDIRSYNITIGGT